MKRNRSTGKIIKVKAHFYTYGRRQEFGTNNDKAHAPVIKWSAISTFLALSIINNWRERSIDFDQDCTQVTATLAHVILFQWDL